MTNALLLLPFVSLFTFETFLEKRFDQNNMKISKYYYEMLVIYLITYLFTLKLDEIQ